MKTRLIAAFAGSALMVLAIPSLAPAQNNGGGNGGATNPAASSLLNRAHQMNQEEEHMAGMLNNKAGDNQALMTLATTLKDDHAANDTAVKALANQENVNLENYQPNKAAMHRLDQLNGAAFNEAFLENEIKDHRQALHEFEQAQNQPHKRDVKVYIDETIPVLRSHLQMAENLRRDMSEYGSPENAANNQQNNGNSNNGGNNNGNNQQSSNQ